MESLEKNLYDKSSQHFDYRLDTERCLGKTANTLQERESVVLSDSYEEEGKSVVWYDS